MAILGGGRHHRIGFCDVISIANLLGAWQQFSKGKWADPEVAAFALRLEDNLFSLQEQLVCGAWTNDPYMRRPISDPKPRIIHVPSVRDRVFFQAVYQQLYPVFDRGFIHDSYASRTGKGTHAGVRRLAAFARRLSRNDTRGVFVLKCDIRRFFDTIDHSILLGLLRRGVDDTGLLQLLARIVGSFETVPGKGLPLGNVTSQLFGNVYLNELDQFMKRVLKQPYYIRYCDDFVILGTDAEQFRALIQHIRRFLENMLRLRLHPDKVSIRALHQGVDFLGYVTLPLFRVLRTRTKRRMFRRCGAIFQHRETEVDELHAARVLSSYQGLLSHAREYGSWKRLERLHNETAGHTANGMRQSRHRERIKSDSEKTDRKIDAEVH